MKQTKQTITNMSWTQFEIACLQIAKQVPKTTTNIYGVPRGGLIVAVRLSHLLSKPLTLFPQKITKSTLIVDDISDTGRTLSNLKKKHPNAKTATLVYHPKTKFIPDIWVYKKGKDWVTFPWEVKK